MTHVEFLFDENGKPENFELPEYKYNAPLEVIIEVCKSYKVCAITFYYDYSPDYYVDKSGNFYQLRNRNIKYPLEE